MSTSSLELSRQLLVGELVKRAAHKSPNRLAYIHKDEKRTFKQIDERASHLAGWLQSQNINFDDKVGFILKNGMAFVEVFYGIALSGGVGVPINFRLVAEEIEYIVNDSECKLLIIDEEYLATLHSIKDRLPNVETIVVVGQVSNEDDVIPYETIFEAKAKYEPVQQTDNDSCMIVYTSGTTGRPKGAVLSHKNLCQNGMNMLWEAKIGLNNKQLVVAPLFHIAAMSTLINTCLVEGTSVIHRDFDPVAVLQTISQEQINAIFLVPAMWNFLFQVPNLTDYDLSSVKISITGGAIAPVEIKKRIINNFPNAGLFDAFGQTEMSPVTTCLHPEDTLRKPNSVGRPVINVEVRVVDEQMNDVPIGEVGEIVYRGPNLMKGYYNNPEATVEAFTGGWFHSGDLVKMDEEGFIYIIDRKKDMIISGGENIYPAEIEEVLYTHPDILECAIIGVPDQDWGENVKAYIVLKQGTSLDKSAVIDYCAKKLASYKKPKEVEFIEELPRNAAGKVLKQLLRKRDETKSETSSLQND